MVSVRRRPGGRKSWALAVAGTLIFALPVVSIAGDRKPPALKISNPRNGTILQGIVAVQGSVRDQGGVQNVEIGIDDGPSVAVEATSPWTFALDTTPHANGPHKIVVRAADLSGNVATSSVSVKFENGPPPDVTSPIVTIAAPSEGETVSGSVAVSGLAVDETAISTIEMSLDNGDFSPVLAASEWAFTLDGSQLAPGDHVVNVRASDAAGNVGTANRAFTVSDGAGTGGEPSSDTPPEAEPPDPIPEPTPTPTCAGVEVSTTADLQVKIDANPQGTTFCLEEGVHDLPVGGVLVKSFDWIIGEPGAVLDGRGIATRGLYGFGGETGQKEVVVRGLVIRNVAGQAIKAGWSWLIEDNEVLGSTVGVAVNQGVVVGRNRIHHNAQYGIVGGPTSNVLIVGNELDHNNTSNSCGGACAENAGGSKIVGSTPGTYGVVWRGNWVHDNTGNGIWSDGNVHDVLYEDNLVEGNTGNGIFHEISWAATIRDNVVRGNATDAVGRSCWWGAQIHVNNSQRVRIVGNRVGSGAGANGICLVDVTRDETSPFSTRLADIDVRNNVIRLAADAMTGLVGNTARSITFDANSYFVPTLAGKHWAWPDRYPLTWTEFRARSQEVSGSRDLDG